MLLDDSQVANVEVYTASMPNNACICWGVAGWLLGFGGGVSWSFFSSLLSELV